MCTLFVTDKTKCVDCIVRIVRGDQALKQMVTLKSEYYTTGTRTEHNIIESWFSLRIILSSKLEK